MSAEAMVPAQTRLRLSWVVSERAGAESARVQAFWVVLHRSVRAGGPWAGALRQAWRTQGQLVCRSARRVFFWLVRRSIVPMDRIGEYYAVGKYAVADIMRLIAKVSQGLGV